MMAKVQPPFEDVQTGGRKHGGAERSKALLRSGEGPVSTCESLNHSEIGCLTYS